MGSKGGHLRPPKEDAPKEDGPLKRRTNLPKGGLLATLRLGECMFVFEASPSLGLWCDVYSAKRMDYSVHD